jgi:hypothetical protein
MAAPTLGTEGINGVTCKLGTMEEVVSYGPLFPFAPYQKITYAGLACRD